MNISRQTLSKYVKTGKLKVRTLPNGDYDYDMESACEILNGGRRRTVVVYMGECGSDALRKEREAAVECFMKDNLGEDVTVVSDDDEYDMADILMDVQRFAVKSLVIMDDDYETIGRVECLGPMFAAARCEVKLLQAVKRDQSWTQDSLANIVTRMLAGTEDETLRKKLQLVLGILRM